MSEPMTEEQEEERGDRAVRDPATEHLQRTKPDRSHSSQGPLSSIRAAIKRSRTNSPIDHSRERRRPEITILSAEPLANSSWFPGASGIFNSPPAPPPPPPAPESSWPGSVQADPQPPPSYDQVIKEKTQEEHVSRPTAAPRRLACTSTSATQTDPVREDTSASPRLSPASETGRKPNVKKPQKPPRPSLLKTQCREPTIVKSEPTNIQCTNVSIGTENQNDSKSCIEQRNTKESKHTCSRSVTVQWDGSAKDLIQHIKVPVNSQSPPADFSTPSSEPEPVECPIPLPRLKKYHRKPLTEEVSVSVQTLVSLSDNVEDNQVNSSNNQEELSSNKYIEQLLEVFGADNSSLENDKASESNSTEQSTEADDKMSAMHSQREVSARIAAFETKPSTEEETAAQRPKPLPRNASIKPPVSSKPSIASRASFKHSRENNNNNNVMPPKPLVASRPQKPSPAPRPQHALQPGGYPSIGGPQDMMPSKGPVLPSARLSIKAKVKGLEQQLQQENCVLTPPVPGEKPFKEPLLPNLNLNNHNSTFMATEDQDYDSSSNFIGHLQETMPSRVAVLPTSRPTPPVPPNKPDKEPPGPNLNHDSEGEYDRQSNFIGELQATIASKVPVLPPFHSSTMAKVESQEPQQENYAPAPPVKPFKEPLVPNFNKYNSEDQYYDRSNSIGDLQETIASKVPVLPLSRHSIMAKVKSQEPQQENYAPAPPVKPFQEPLVPNFNNNNFPLKATEDQYYNRFNSIGDLQGTMPSRVAVLPTSRPSPPVPPTKVFREPPGPNLHHDSALMAAGDEYNRPSNRAPFQHQQSLDSGFSGYQNKQSITRRPTTIRPNSMTSRTLSLDTPPSLPSQKPVGSMQHQESFYKGQEPTRPPRPGGGKVLPPRPPPAKVGPARPPQPGHSAPGRASLGPASQRGAQSAAPVQRPGRRGPALPPRPRPGHRLYNQYTLELPHGIAVCNYNGPNTGELSFQKNDVLLLLEEMDQRTVMCQVGEGKGLVQRCHMKVITPLAPQEAPQIPNQASSSEGGGLQVQAIHDFDPAGPEELGLRAGDVAIMVEQVDNDWYKGTCRGNTGFFPVNYVNVLSNSPLPSREKKPSATVSGPRCVARFDFEGEGGTELTFSEGDVISLMEYLGDEWAKGQLGAYTGVYPLNFVEVVEDLPLPPMTQQQPQTRIALPGLTAHPNIQPEAVKPIQAPQPSGPEWVVALYDFNGQTGEDLSFKQGDRILVTKHLDTVWWSGRLNGYEGIFPSAFVGGSPGQSLHNKPQSSEAEGSKAKALFRFTAESPEELSLQAGDIITNLESVDDEWFLGELRGKRALVPKNYVQVLG
ncbi:unnamed protein product [Gadus morhua 'NCC']